ncbi:MAG: TrmH family RNA methyltransferase [Bacilli bacterium]
MIKKIDSKTNKKIVFLTKLKNPSFRNENKLFISEGIYNLNMALKEGIVKEIYTLSFLDFVPKDIDQYIVNEDIIKKISSTKNPQGIVFVSHFLDKKLQSDNHLVYLDDVQDPGNLGTIIRTALALNYDGVILSKGCCSIYNEKVIASSKGAIYCLPLIYDDISSFKKSHTIISTTLKDISVPINEIKLNEKFIICFGNESHGISSKLEEISNEFVKIPMSNIDSLNVAVSSGIILYKIKEIGDF